jgi:hypothetical protein
MVSLILLGTGVVSMAATASLLTGLLLAARTASKVTEEQQEKVVEKDKCVSQEGQSDEDKPPTAS